jgi:hypothetical protein
MTVNDLKSNIAGLEGGDLSTFRLKIEGNIIPLAQGTEPLATLPGYPSWRSIETDLISTRPYEIRVDAGELGCALQTVIYSDSFGSLKSRALSKLQAGGNQPYVNNIDEKTLEYYYMGTRSDTELLVDAGVDAGSTLLLRPRMGPPCKHLSGPYCYLVTDTFPPSISASVARHSLGAFCSGVLTSE